MSRVLITGGNGFLGKSLADRLFSNGEDVHIFARRHSGSNNEVNKKYTVCWGDIRDAEAVDKAVERIDIVIHLVSNFRKGGSDKKEAFSINVEGTENVLKAALKHEVKRVIHCSTIGVHGNVRSIPANEKTAFNPGDLYQETKLTAERLVWKTYKETGLPLTVVRPISMLGPGDLRMLKLFKMIKKRRFVIVGNGEVLFQPAYIDDVVDGFVKCMHNERAIGEVYIIGGDEYVSLNQLCRLIADEMNVSPPRIRVPMFPVLLLASMCEFICEPLNIDPPLHRRRVSFFQNNRAFSIEKARRELAYKPKVSLREGIRRTIQWYEENQLL